MRVKLISAFLSNTAMSSLRLIPDIVLSHHEAVGCANEGGGSCLTAGSAT